MIVGYGVIVLLTSLGLNDLLGGRTLYGGPALMLAAGLLVALLVNLEVAGATPGSLVL
jgi:hypothetical protein